MINLTNEEAQQLLDELWNSFNEEATKQNLLIAIEALRAALAQPESEWQGLTHEEIGAMEKEYLFGGKEFDDEIGYWAVYRAIEAKLKEKNT